MCVYIYTKILRTWHGRKNVKISQYQMYYLSELGNLTAQTSNTNSHFEVLDYLYVYRIDRMSQVLVLVLVFHRSSCWCRFFALSLVAFRTVSDLGTSLVLEKFSVFSFSVPGIGFAFTDFFPWMSVDFPELTRSTSGSESMSISPQSHALFWESLKEVQPNMVVPVNISSAVALHPAIDHVTVGDVVSNYILHPLHNRFTV